MNATEEVVFEAAMALPPEVRAELAERLWESLDHDQTQQPSPEILEEWLTEIRRRVQEVREGRAELIPDRKSVCRERVWRYV